MMTLRCLRVGFLETDVGDVVEGSLAEINVLKVRVHVEAGRSEVVGPRYVRYDAFTITPDVGLPHPHVPVPSLTSKE